MWPVLRRLRDAVLLSLALANGWHLLVAGCRLFLSLRARKFPIPETLR